jgi:uncharacterized cupredoxin-like copper-binding protein
MTWSRIIPLAAIALAIPAFVAGCGSTSNNSTVASPTTTVSTMTEAKTASPIAITLSDMAITPADVNAAAGEVTFDVTNNGKMAHEVVVIKTDKKAADLGPADAEGKVSETGSQGETGDIEAGASKTLTLTLPKGHYALICNISGHYAAGMYADLTVS